MALATSPDDGTRLNPTHRLLLRAHGDDQRAFTELYRRFQRPLMTWAHGRLCRQARGQNETRDLVHISISKAFLSVRKKEFDYRHPGAFVGFLHQILRNEVASINRQYLIRPPMQALSADHADPSTLPDRKVEDDERWALYERGLATLKQDDQLLIRLREMGMSHADIGEEVDLTPNAARMAVKRAIDRLAEAIRRMLQQRTNEAR